MVSVASWPCASFSKLFQRVRLSLHSVRTGELGERRNSYSKTGAGGINEAIC